MQHLESFENFEHLDEGTVHAWLDGALPPDEAEHARGARDGCAQCAAAVADARGLIAGCIADRVVARRTRPGVIPAPAGALRRRPSRRARSGAGCICRRVAAALAASILVVVAGER